METKDNIVKMAISNLLQKHNLQESIGCVDEVVLIYVLSILEVLGDGQNPEENIDVDQFIEMMTAYIPGFSEINSVEIYEWMFEISSKLSSKLNTSTNNVTVTKRDESSLNSTSSGLCNSNKKQKQRLRKTSHSTSESNSTTDNLVTQKLDDGGIQMLFEMFPASCSIEVKHCLKLCNGNIEETAQLILEKQEKGHILKSKLQEKFWKLSGEKPGKLLITVIEEKKNEQKSTGLEPDKSIKDHVVAKYSYVDTEEDERTHRPPPVKEGPKKLVRYLDSKVVNTKGQRYTEIKKPEDEELKKTYVSLKPAKQYRFH